jgi:hypothetical protein
MLVGVAHQLCQTAFKESLVAVENGSELHLNPRLKTGSNDDRTAAKEEVAYEKGARAGHKNQRRICCSGGALFHSGWFTCGSEEISRKW